MLLPSPLSPPPIPAPFAPPLAITSASMMVMFFAFGQVASADTGSIIAADRHDASACDFDIAADSGVRSLITAAANTCTAYISGGFGLSYGRNISAGNGDVGAVAAPAAANTGSTVVAGGKNIAAGNGDVFGTCVFTAADACTAAAADGYQLAGAGFGADGQIAAVALFHTGVCVSALQGVVQFNVQVDVAGALGSHRRVACTLRPCAAGGVDVGVLQGHVGRRPASALMVTLLVVEAEESRFRMTGAESSLVTPP